MINKDNYLSEVNRIGVSNLPEALRDGHEFLLKVTSNGTVWDNLMPNGSAVVKLQMEKLDDYLKANKSEVTTKEKKPRKRREKPAAKPEKKLIKVKRTKPKAAAAKVEKPAKAVKVKKTKNKAKVRVKVVKPAKAPVTVKKYSLELQHIKRFAHLHGKDHKVSALASFLKTIKKHIDADDYLNHRSMITEIAIRLDKGLEAAQGSTVMAVTIEPAFREKVQDLVANAKVRMRTEFLAGINSEKRSKKQS